MRDKIKIKFWIIIREIEGNKNKWYGKQALDY
jgi:hypothetical protein